MTVSLAVVRLRAERSRLDTVAVRFRLHALGCGTIDLDESEAELRARDGVYVVGAADDELLGARCRIVVAPRRRSVLLEPSTEGRLAGALARFGPGPVVSYLVASPSDADVVTPAAAAGVALSTVRRGPFGPSRLVLGGPRWGPFLVLVDPVAGTIGP